MILGFTKKIKGGKPTEFREKVLDGRKIHSIREDKHDRWREGMSIEMAYGVRSDDYEQWNADRPDLQTCTGTQPFEIKWKGHDYQVRVDGHRLTPAEVEQLAKNDGFDELVDFLTWFSSDFKGKIIHWTKMRY